MLFQETLQEKLQKYDFDQLAWKESDEDRQIRLLALAHLKEDRNGNGVTQHAVMRWMPRFANGGVDRLANPRHYPFTPFAPLD